LIAVTGATGHLGNVLVRELLASHQQVRAVVLAQDSTRPLSGLDVEMFPGDVIDINSLERAFTGVDIVFHLGGIVTIMPGKTDLLERVNVGGVRNVISTCRSQNVHRLIYVSSVHAIAEPPHGTVIDETFPFDPDRVLGDYARSKAKATLILKEEVKKGLDAVILCPTGIIGPYDWYISNIGQLIIDFASGHLKSYVSGAYDFVDVRDVAQGLIKAAEKGKTGRHYILSGDQVQVPELMEELAKDIGYPAPTYRIPSNIARAAGVLASVYYRILRRKAVFTAYSIDVLASNSHISSARARSELGFSTRSWKESIHDQVEWFRQQDLLPKRR
jgi:dihydroflavonol-4-reductase